MIRRVAAVWRRLVAMWDRINHHLSKHPEPDGEAVTCDLEEFDREFLYHLYTVDNAAQLFVQAAEQLEVQS